MTVIYQTTITRIGASATDALGDQMLIRRHLETLVRGRVMEAGNNRQ